MATAKPMNRQPARSWIRRIGLVAAAVVLFLLVWLWARVNAYAVTGASYGAHVACSCRFAGGRSLADCARDLEPGMGLVSLSEDTKTRSVTARFPLLSSQTARYREGDGCQLERWKD